MIKEKVKNLVLYKKLKSLYKKYERLIIPGSLVFGFVIDIITFKSIDINFAFIILGIHILLVGFAISFINIYDEKWLNLSNKYIGYVRLASPIIMQFSFGALLSASFIFYSFGGVFSVSWPFILLLLFLMVSNEIFKQAYLKQSVQISILFFVLLTLLSLVFPFIFKSISPWVFVGSSILAIFIIGAYVFFISKYVLSFKEKQPKIALSVSIIWVFMNVLYFTNVIPPIPISLRDSGVYHNITRVGDFYNISDETESFFQKIIPGKTIHIEKGYPVYIYTAIFSPANLNTEIVHHWQWYDESTKSWVSRNRLSFGIKGGRENGYRGYSLSNNIPQGKWRVFVETKRGQVLGKVSFRAEYVEEKKETKTILK
jgi:hypothetical protein